MRRSGNPLWKLRRGVKFHDGSEFTSKDAKATYDKIISPPEGVVSRRKGLDEEAHYLYTLQWHRIVPHNAKVRGWTITPSHYLNQQLDTAWLAE